ncbi:MAG: CapA family protein [Kofleriaceae bacterium]
MRASWVVAVLTACGNTTTSSPTGTGASSGAAPIATQPPAAGSAAAPCDPAVPAAACKLAGGLRVCKPGEPDRVGEWRYAIMVPPYITVEDLAVDRLTALWKGDKIELAASAETQAALTVVLGPGKLATIESGVRPTIDDAHWAIVPAHELVPNYKAITIAGKHSLDKTPNALVAPLCGPSKLAVHNIDPAKLTRMAMTGTTALTRFTATLMDEKGVLYPLSAVEPWLADADFVHVSNEVSFVPKCDAGTKPTMSFCSKDAYMDLLVKSHVNIVEQTGSHLQDYGRNWIDRTLDMYKERGWLWFGGGHDQLEATQPKFLEHAGTRFAFLGCNMVWTTSKVIFPGPGVAACDLPRLTWQIRDLRAQGYTVIVSVQHEEVYGHDPPSILVSDLRKLAEAGAAFVMGSQAHCAHPWEVHHGAYVHYGPGNFYFDQFWHPVRDAAQDKLYFHAGKLLAVNHLYTRIEERGRPRLLTEPERSEFLVDLARALKKLPAAKPWEAPIEVAASRDRPDAILVRGAVQQITVKVPAKLEAGKKYPLVVELGGPASTDDNAFVVTPARKRAPAATTEKLGSGIASWMTAKYPVDPDQITLNTPPSKTKRKNKPR